MGSGEAVCGIPLRTASLTKKLSGASFAAPGASVGANERVLYEVVVVHASTSRAETATGGIGKILIPVRS